MQRFTPDAGISREILNSLASKWRSKITSGLPAIHTSLLLAGTRLIGPFKLDRIIAKSAGFPCTDVPDFTIFIVIPTLPGNGVGDRFAKFMRGCRSESIKGSQAASATRAARIRHHGVVDPLTE